MQEVPEVVHKTEEVVTAGANKPEQKTEQQPIVIAPAVDFQRPRVQREVVEQEAQAAVEALPADKTAVAENIEIQDQLESASVAPQAPTEQLIQDNPTEQTPSAPEPTVLVQSEGRIPIQEPTLSVEQPVASPNELSPPAKVEIVEAPLVVATPPETEEPETITLFEQSVAVFTPEPFVPQSEAVPTEEMPYVPTEEVVAVQAVTEEVYAEPAVQEPVESAVPVTHPEVTLELGPPAVTDNIEYFEAFVAELHDLEAPPEKLELVHEKVEKITELTVIIREAKLLDAGEGVAEITEELVATFIDLFEATGMNVGEEHVRHMVQLWIARDVLSGKDFETAKAELFEDKGMREVLQQFMHGIAQLKELLESLHVRLGKLVLAGAVQPSQSV